MRAMEKTAKRLEALYATIVSNPVIRLDEHFTLYEEYKALLGELDLPRTHTYWSHYYYYRIMCLYELGKLEEALALTEEGKTHTPEYVGIWLWEGAIQYRLGNMVPAFRAYLRAMRAGAEIKDTGPRLVAILANRKRYRMAAKFGRKLVDSGHANPPLLGVMAEIELALKNAREALRHLDARELVASANSYTQSLRQRAERLLAHDMRHVAIAGMSYVGSTLLGTILGSLPGCAHAGETQELIYAANPKAYDFRLIDFANAADDAIPQCRNCGPSCKVFDRNFRAELVRDPVDWYFRIGRRLGAPIIISSDKFLSEYLNKDPLARYDIIILYKSLESWVVSHRREEARKAAYGVSTSPDAANLVETLNQWADNYHGFLKELLPVGRRIVLNWERFSERPHEHLIRIIKNLGLSGDTTVFDHIREQHYLGGNDAMIDVFNAGQVKFRSPRTGRATIEDRAVINSHKSAQQIFHMLEACYQSEFRNLAGD